jgi:hypothetical protein
LNTHNNLNISEIFDQAYENLSNLNITEEQLFIFTNSNNPELRLIFDEAFTSLRPNKRNEKINRNIITSDKRDLIDQEMNLVANRTAKIVKVIEFEKQQEEARKRLFLKQQQDDERIIILPTLFDRVIAGIYDSSLIIAITTVITVIFWFIWNPSRIHETLKLTQLDSEEVIRFSSIFLSLLIVNMWIIPLIYYLKHERTPGLKLRNIRISAFEGRPTKIHLVVRATLIPISLTLQTWVLPIIGINPLHDLIARTYLRKT